MNFSDFEVIYQKWKDILVIGKTVERNGKKCHLIGMTLDEVVKLYIIEPYIDEEEDSRKVFTQREELRKMITRQKDGENYFFHFKEISFGEEKYEMDGGTGTPLEFSKYDYEIMQLFFDMLHAGWKIPEWLKSEDWEHLSLSTLEFRNAKSLPKFSLDLPILVKHDYSSVDYLLEKAVSLNIGKKHDFHFMDHNGDQVECYINDVYLVDVWQIAKDQFQNPKYAEHFSAEEIKSMESEFFRTLEKNCPKGMFYIGIEYECSKDYNLKFYTKEFLNSVPKQEEGCTSMIFFGRLKPDKEFGIHHLPLKGCMVESAISSDAVMLSKEFKIPMKSKIPMESEISMESKIPMELFSYSEKVDEWEEEITCEL